MKKILSLILALMLLLLCLASCDSSKHEHITGDWKYNEYGHWQPITCSLNTCHIEEAPISDHVDDNTDNICDICGYTQMLSTEQPTDSNTECVHILKDGFAFKESWIDSNNELTESKTFVVESQEALNEIFTEFKDVNFDKEMVIVYCYTTIYVREQKLEKVSLDNGVLSIEFDVVDGKPGTGDATAPQTRTCVICLDKVAATEVKITYNGQ